MSIVALKGVPSKWGLKGLYAVILRGAKTLRGKFELLNFALTKPLGDFKTAYLRVSEKVDPLRVVEILNRLSSRNFKFHAYVPKHVPDLPLAHQNATKQRMYKTKRPNSQTAEFVLECTHRNLLEELQRKYRGLPDLSKKTDDNLLDEIALTLFRRLKSIMEPSNHDNVFSLSKAYRTAHPHFADFQLILSTLHRVEDAVAAPRTQLHEHDLMHAEVSLSRPDPLDKVNKICAKYVTKIVNKVTLEIEALVTEGAAWTQEKAERRRVRAELKRLRPYVPAMMKQIVSNMFSPDSMTSRQKLLIYGEPMLPGREALNPALRKYQAVFERSHRMFNMIRCSVPLGQYPAVLAVDGTVVGGSKLVIRPATPLEYTLKPDLLAKIAMAFVPEAVKEQNLDFSDGEDWGPDVEM